MDDEDKESTSESVQEVTDIDFKVFYRIDAPSTSQAHTLEDMGFEKKTLDLLALLTAHAGDSSPIRIRLLTSIQSLFKILAVS